MESKQFETSNVEEIAEEVLAKTIRDDLIAHDYANNPSMITNTQNIILHTDLSAIGDLSTYPSNYFPITLTNGTTTSTAEQTPGPSRTVYLNSQEELVTLDQKSKTVVQRTEEISQYPSLTITRNKRTSRRPSNASYFYGSPPESPSSPPPSPPPQKISKNSFKNCKGRKGRTTKDNFVSHPVPILPKPAPAAKQPASQPNSSKQEFRKEIIRDTSEPVSFSLRDAVVYRTKKHLHPECKSIGNGINVGPILNNSAIFELPVDFATGGPWTSANVNIDSRSNQCCNICRRKIEHCACQIGKYTSVITLNYTLFRTKIGCEENCIL